MNVEDLFIKLTSSFIWLGTPIDYGQNRRSFRKTVALKLWFSYLLFVYSFFLVGGFYFLIHRASHVEDFTSSFLQIVASTLMIVKLINLTIQKRDFEKLMQEVAKLEKSI